MSYTALYRKFRPLNFDEMVGQKHITDTLKKQIIAGRVGHAYLFNGGRGTGKTSAAKILARAVNCLNPHDGEPCNECEICKAIISGSLTDVVEMDAASNNSVEDIRSIREEVNFLPTRAKYRVYIIDEVHMLSTGAFNALLKTLEEPPKHVKFILATTEPQKLPATILSRCQRFDFKRISNEDIIKRLETICKESKIEITEEALKIIAVLAEGAMRDAISILERCAGEQKGLIDDNYVRDLVGIPKMDQIYSIVNAIIEQDVEEVIKVSNSIIEEGKDIDNFLWEIIKYIKDLLVYKSTKTLDLYSKNDKQRLEELAGKTENNKLLYLIYNLSELANSIKWSSQKTIMFEAGIMKACMQQIDENNVKTNEKSAIEIKQVEKKVQTNSQASSQVKASIKNSNIENVSNNDQQKANQQPKVENNSFNWNNVINKIKDSGKMGVYVNLIGSTAREINDMTIEVKIANKNAFAKSVLESHENKAQIEKIASMEAGKVINIRFVDSQDAKKVTKGQAKSIESIADNLDIPINIIDE